MRDDHVNVFYSEEDGGYIADIPDLKYCSAFGTTAAEALRQVDKAKDLWLETARDFISLSATKWGRGLG
jgi:predicted RNase H-like HicB family nuclease